MFRHINILKDRLLSDNWFRLRNYTYELIKPDGRRICQKREVYDRGNGATVLLFNRHKATVLLIRQFRLPTYLNGNADGVLIETCAGLLDDDLPEDCIRKEAMEETGYEVGEVTKLFSAYMSPGGVTELLHFFAAQYHDTQRINDGGGVEDEDIDVLELPFAQALQMVASGEIKDGKTIMLLQYAQIHHLLEQPEA
jgi:GDP-mannose pyrophosphatase NudK